MTNKTIILKNITIGEITIVGFIIPASDEVDVSEVSSTELRNDPTLTASIISGDIVVNNGTKDLSVANGGNYISNDVVADEDDFWYSARRRFGILINQTAHEFLVGAPVRFDNGSSLWVVCQANDPLNAELSGCIQEILDVDNFYLGLPGAVIENIDPIVILGGPTLVAGEAYFISELIAGRLSPVAPIGTGDIIKPIGVAISTTAMILVNYLGVAASGLTAGGGSAGPVPNLRLPDLPIHFLDDAVSVFDAIRWKSTKIEGTIGFSNAATTPSGLSAGDNLQLDDSNVGPITITFSTLDISGTDISLNQVVSDINTAAVGNIQASIFTDGSGNNFLRLENIGITVIDKQIILAAGTPDALVTLGLSPTTANGNVYVGAQADTNENAEFVGFVNSLVPVEFEIVINGTISGFTNLVSGKVYFLSPTTPGAITENEPTGIGEISKPVLIATSQTEGFVVEQRGLTAPILENIVDDITPQLGGNLDVNTFGLGDGINLLLDFVEDASAVNYIQIENEATGLGAIIRAVGSDTNIDLNLSSKGLSVVNISPQLEVSAGTGSLLAADFHASVTSSIRARSETGHTLQLLAGTERTVISSSIGSSLAFCTNSDNDLANPTNERMRILSNGNIGINTITPDGTLHVHTATAGSVTAVSGADDLIVENNVDAGISILGPVNAFQSLVFGSPSDAAGAKIRWTHTEGTLEIGSERLGGEVAIFSGNYIEAARFDSAGSLGIGTGGPLGKLHIRRGAAVVSPNFLASTLVVEESLQSAGGISILGPADNNQQIFFGSPSNVAGATLVWNHTAGNFTIDVAGSGNVAISGISYPNADGITGQSLETDGSGNLSFASKYLGAFTVASLPTASSHTNALALVTNASGGRTLVISDGTNWKVFSTEGATVTV